ncbi:uncharacterized protein LOC114535296 [Dendronephthya gigantea]|uniref:uncharacterized protein LOC114535296 n=1 Tax=Dendronephthya gigantea TaxID=151771 RepID=UPI00106CF2C8|nr:uncharacterized protein LOC114535296 [Dendronephthya gigantea]
MNDVDTKEKLPIHLVLGNGEYARVKTRTKPLLSGKDSEPVAEKTKCSGLTDAKENDQHSVYEEFKEQLVRNPAGYYETNLPWKPNHPPLPTNKAGSRRRLTTLVRKLRREGNYEQYDNVIRDQINQGIIEVAPEEPKGRVFYLPHTGVVKSSAETTKWRVVYDASAKEQNNQPSLNECLSPGPPLQNLLWEILIRSRFHPVILTSDIEKAFLQVRIKEQDEIFQGLYN